MPKLSWAIAVSLLIGFVPSLGMAANAPASVPESKTATDVANIAVVKAFTAEFNTPEKGAEYLSDKAVLRMEEGKPAITGRKAFVDAVKPYIAQGQHFSIRYLEVFARSPVVVTHRVDTIQVAGKPDESYEIVGIFVVKDGKIVEWSDYLSK
jgi:limonene-1,2-epoxide hydrolase